MFTLPRSIGIPNGDSLARARRVTEAVMSELSQEIHWGNPFEKVSIYAAVDRCVGALIINGEGNDDVVKTKALETVRAPNRRR